MYEVADYKGNSIWLADDTTLIANSKENLERNLRILKEAAQKYGLEINIKKTKLLRIRGEENYKEIAGCEIIKQTKYLGITVGGKGRDIFKFERENWMIKAKKGIRKINKRNRQMLRQSYSGKSTMETGTNGRVNVWQGSSNSLGCGYKEDTNDWI